MFTKHHRGGVSSLVKTLCTGNYGRYMHVGIHVPTTCVCLVLPSILPPTAAVSREMFQRKRLVKCSAKAKTEANFTKNSRKRIAPGFRLVVPRTLRFLPFFVILPSGSAASTTFNVVPGVQHILATCARQSNSPS